MSGSSLVARGLAGAMTAALVGVTATVVLADDTDVAALGKRLRKAKSGKERGQAADALKALGEEAGDAVPALVAALADDEPVRDSSEGGFRIEGDPDTVARHAMMALEEVGAPAIDPLIDALGERNANVRSHASEALESLAMRAEGLPDEEAVAWRGRFARAARPLVKILVKDGKRPAPKKSKPAKKPTGAGVIEFGDAGGGPTPADRAVKILGIIGARAVAPVTDVLKHRDRDVRRRAAQVLSLVGAEAEPALDPLLDALGDHEGKKLRQRPVDEGELDTFANFFAGASKTVGGFAAVALSNIGEPAVESLIQRLRDEDAAVRENALRALNGIGKPASAAIPAVEALLEDPDERVRIGASVTLRTLER